MNLSTDLNKFNANDMNQRNKKAEYIHHYQ